MTKLTRRTLLSAAGIYIVPRRVLGGPGYKAPSDTLNIAGVGIGGMGRNYLKGCNSENIVALCDVDNAYAAKVFRTYPEAKRYRDFRVMLEKEKGIDAVIIGTPDHVHAAVAQRAMKLGKHVYCAKPLTRTIHEARIVAKTARETKVATQMSVQSCASEKSNQTAEWVRSGVIGKVREVHVWSDRPVWAQALDRPKDTAPVPATLDWDLWLGPAPERPYNPAYHPFNFRGWYDFGTGALGDMGCHTFHVIARALRLGDPVSVSATNAQVRRPLLPGDPPHWSGSKWEKYPETYPNASIVNWYFPKRKKLPAVRLTWYDGGLKPPRPLAMASNAELGADGILFIGAKGVIESGFTGGPRLHPESRFRHFRPPKPTLERTIGHYKEWIEACKGGQPAHCEFEFGSYLTELTLLGDLVVRSGKSFTWNAAEGSTSDPDANQYVRQYRRPGWELG